MTPSQQHNLRRVALLVDSLDDAVGDALLAGLPKADRDAVRLIAAELGPVDPVEREAVLTDFRRSAARRASRPDPGVELQLSSPTGTADEVPVTLAAEDAAELASYLSEEHPQTVAVMLSMLDPDAAAEVLDRLPEHLQTEAIQRLSDPEVTDSDAVAVVQSQLAEWLARQQQRKARAAAGVQLVQRLLAGAKPCHHHAILARLEQTNPRLAQRLSGGKARTPNPEPPPRLPKPSAVASPPLPAGRSVAVRNSRPPIQPLTELMNADEHLLRAALASCSPDVVLLTLAGGGEEMLARVVKGQPRKVARDLRHKVRSLGPTRLADMLRAQAEVARALRSCAEAPPATGDTHTRAPHQD